MKMYKDDVIANVAKDQIPAMKAGGWSGKKAENKETENVSENKETENVSENEASETKVKKTIKKKKVIKKLKKED